MNSATTLIFCALCFLASIEAYVICGSGELDNTLCTKITECETIVSRLNEIVKGNISEFDSFFYEVQKLQCRPQTDNSLDFEICCPVKRNYPSICGSMLEDKMLMGDGIADPLDYEWLALLEYKTPNGTQIQCSGVLISDRYVLTAASCLVGSYNVTGVRLGEYNLSTEIDSFDLRYDLPKYASIGIAKEIIHENFSSLHGAFDTFLPDKNDIAILELVRSVVTQPICLPTKESNYKRFFSVGWGSSPFDKVPKFPVKSLVMMENSTCVDENVEKTICVEPRTKKYGCVPDVGSPIMQREIVEDIPFVVVGIHAPNEDVNPCVTEKKTYADVYKYRDWILKNMHWVN